GVLAALPCVAGAETYHPAQTFLDPAAARGDAFGSAVALVGLEALVGAPGPPTGALPRLGHAYRLDAGTGAVLQTFAGPVADPGTGFGDAIAPVGANVLVGAPLAAGSSGAAYLLDGTTGAVLHTFANPSASTTLFGGYVGTLGPDVLIGSLALGGG